MAEDSPALLTLGAQYEISDRWRVMAGYHHFFDVDCKQYYGDKLGDTNEFNFGTEYDLTKKLQVSAGYQKTLYDQEDSNMSDISFNVSSYTFGFGAGYQLTEKVKLNAAYFQTNYGTKTVVETPVVNTYPTACSVWVATSRSKPRRIYSTDIAAMIKAQSVRAGCAFIGRLFIPLHHKK